jgi:hypothetical protein
VNGGRRLFKMLKGVTYVGEVQKREMSWMGLENRHVEKMGQYSMEDVSLIVMYGDVGLEGPKRFTLDLF